MAASTKVSDMCRLCGTDTLNVVRHHIFEGEGQVKKSAQKISECLPLHIAAEDPLPKNICGECSYKLDLMSDFREKAVKTDVMLVSLVEGVKPEIPDDDDDGPDHEIDNDFRSDTPVEQPEQQTEPEVLIKEEEAQQPQQPEKRPGRKAANKRPIQESDMEEEEEEAPAKKRGRKPKEKETAPAASATTSASTNPPKENTGLEPPCKLLLYQCVFCNTLLASSELVRTHIEKLHPKTIKCSFCDAKFRSESFLAEHLHVCEKNRSEQPRPGVPLLLIVEPPREEPPPATKPVIKCSIDGEEISQCEICNKAFAGKDRINNLKDHMINVHEFDRPFKCSICGKSYRSKYALKLHIELHQEKTIPCDICGKKYVNDLTLRAHVRLVHGPQKYVNCNLCGETFACKNIAKHKMKVHKDPKCMDYECPHCAKKYNCFTQYKNHLLLHVNLITFLCNFCGKGFNSKESLEVHMIPHLGEQKLKCKVCHKRFTVSSILKKHMRNHIGCNVCDQRFRSDFDLEEHMKKGHEPKKHPLEIFVTTEKPAWFNYQCKILT
ncbi:zinc finger protein 317-like isoform X19 [Cloeon dipterum]|uniref:zinc finger protein 317-like isoform X19 n=1 Tax=Cloeon dipterum TaxID=197152 RepID=UPI0032202CE5